MHLASQGATVLAACLTDTGAKEIEAIGAMARDSGGGGGGSIRSFQLDVTSDASIAGALRVVGEMAPSGVDVLVNNAGTMAGSHLVEFTALDTYQRTMDVNFFGVVRMCQAFLPQMKQRAQRSPAGSVRIVNVSSFLGRVSPFSMSAYSSSKYALEAFSDSLRQELVGFGLSVCLVEPGAMSTEMARGMKEDGHRRWEAGRADLKAEYGSDYPRAMARSAMLLDVIARPVAAVVPRMVDAACAVHPKHRYICGLDAVAFAVVSSFLPSWANDRACLTVLGQPQATARKTKAIQTDQKAE